MVLTSHFPDDADQPSFPRKHRVAALEPERYRESVECLQSPNQLHVPDLSKYFIALGSGSKCQPVHVLTERSAAEERREVGSKLFLALEAGQPAPVPVVGKLVEDEPVDNPSYTSSSHPF